MFLLWGCISQALKMFSCMRCFLNGFQWYFRYGATFSLFSSSSFELDQYIFWWFSISDFSLTTYNDSRRAFVCKSYGSSAYDVSRAMYVFNCSQFMRAPKQSVRYVHSSRFQITRRRISHVTYKIETKKLMIEPTLVLILCFLLVVSSVVLFALVFLHGLKNAIDLS